MIPARSVARRFEWRRHLEPDLTPNEAVKRIDPTFSSADAALSDLYRRLGWMREIERDPGGEMEHQLTDLDAGMEQLRSLTRQAHIFKAGGSGAGQDRP